MKSSTDDWTSDHAERGKETWVFCDVCVGGGHN